MREVGNQKYESHDQDNHNNNSDHNFDRPEPFDNAAVHRLNLTGVRILEKFPLRTRGFAWKIGERSDRDRETVCARC